MDYTPLRLFEQEAWDLFQGDKFVRSHYHGNLVHSEYGKESRDNFFFRVTREDYDATTNYLVGANSTEPQILERLMAYLSQLNKDVVNLCNTLREAEG